MNEAYVVDQSFVFKDMIFDIKGISIEHEEDIIGSKLSGDFIITGEYLLNEVSVNKDSFSFKIPFNHEISDNINLDTIDLEITDFNYELLNSDELKVHVEYAICAEQALLEFTNEEELDEFINSNDKLEVVNLDTRDDTLFKEEENIKELTTNDSSKEVILNEVSTKESYVKYHVHNVMPGDTIDSIMSKYNVSLNEIKKYNYFDVLEVNMKLIIPDYEED